MRAIILAGGKGVRLAPVTDVIPKPLVPLGGRPIMEIVIRQLQRHGFRRITLAVGYMADLIQAYFGDGAKLGVNLDYSYEPSPLGTVGPLALIDGLDDTFLVMNADVLTDLNYHDFLNFHKTQGGVATIGAYQRQVRIDLGVIKADGDHRVQAYIEKPMVSHLVSMGVYVFEPEILSYIRGNGYLDFPDLVNRLLREGQRVSYLPHQGYWLDIGRHDDYAQAAEQFDNLNRNLGLFPADTDR
ncbi:MAG: sugar phosphate nucleotidyltransferase [Desulfobaccales bacterium]